MINYNWRFSNCGIVYRGRNRWVLKNSNDGTTLFSTSETDSSKMDPADDYLSY